MLTTGYMPEAKSRGPVHSDPVNGSNPSMGAVGMDPERLAAAGLSPREIEVLALVALGLINEAVGQELGISPRTVQKHLERVHAKLAVGTRMAAVATAQALCRMPA